jgi:hypothetical protein
MTVQRTAEDELPWVNAVYEQPWWLDAVAPGSWSAVEVNRDGSVVARLPYVVRRRQGLVTITQPPLTQTLGPWMAPVAGRYANQLKTQKELLTELIHGLPAFDHFRMNFSPCLTNWLPFYWAGFEATVKYTYRIEDLTDLERIRSDFNEDIRRGVRKAESALSVNHDHPLDDLLRLDALSWERQGQSPHISHEVIRRLDAACAARGSRKILGAVDAQGRTHAVLYVAWDDRMTVALINARDPEIQAFGANALLYWEAIRVAAEKSPVFDFEGSMIEPIEHFLRGFGGRLTPYLSVSRSNARAQAALAARSAAAKVLRR